MADLTITPSAVVSGANASIDSGTAGEAIAAGKAVYKSSTTGKWMLADSNSATVEARKPTGIALNAASLNQPVDVQTLDGSNKSVATPFATNKIAGVHRPVHGSAKADGTVINPATEETLASVLARLNTTLTIQGAVTVSDGTGPLTVDGTVLIGAGTALIGKVGLSIGGTDLARGQATMAQSLPMALASDQSDVPGKPGSTEAKITAATMPAGGVGWTGWLSAIWYQLTQALGVVGNVSAGSTDSGAPVKVGAVVQATPTLRTDGNRTDSITDAYGGQWVSLKSAGSGQGIVGQATNGDGGTVSSAANRLGVLALGQVYNGSTLDRMRGNTTGTIVIPPAGWSFAGASGGIVNTTTAVTLKAAAGASVKNYLEGLQIDQDTLGGATEIVVRDGAGGSTLYRGKLQTATGARNVRFDPPLVGTANTLMEVALLTAVTGGVYVNAQGYVAP